ncbi:hypothetical protein ZEAMMB73_Zm00001d025931 [Zea mays]|uniref:Uncharacterized protein n=1 Tax=Zea mays TaxID=4577 RepID=A0A1D6JAX9_MAIZE|nr:hypothetical protein ZEAMMB73_Zm00001d025931 [Zea mays]
MLPSEKAFSAVVSALGIYNKDGIVVYDGKGLFSDARVWCTKVHQSQVPAHLQNLQAATMRVGVQGSPDHSRDQREQGRKRRVGQGPSTEAVKARRKAWYASLNSSGSKE